MKTNLLLMILLMPFLLQVVLSSTTVSTTADTTTETTNSTSDTTESTTTEDATTETITTTETTTLTDETTTADSVAETTTESTSIEPTSVTTATTEFQETATPELTSSEAPTETTVIITTPSTVSTTETTTTPAETTTDNMTATYESTSVTPSSMYSETPMSATTSPTSESSNGTTDSNSSVDMTSTDVTMTSSISPSSTMETETSASVTTTTPATTTTTTRSLTTPNTGPVNIKEDSAVINVVLPSIRLNFSTTNEVANALRPSLQRVDGFKGVLVNKVNNGNRRKKRDAGLPEYKITIIMDAQLVLSNSTVVQDEIESAFENATGVSAPNFQLSEIDACSADVCVSRLASLKGYLCYSEVMTCTFKHVCSGVSCGENGDCYAETFEGQFKYTAACSCKSETFYYYDGKNCTEKVMKWELALAIAGGVGGALVMIMLFVVICVCARLKRGSDDFSDSSELMFGDALTKHKKRDFKSGNGNSGPLMTYPGSQMYDNNAYYEDTESSAPSGGNNRQSGEWNPEKSANTYAKIESKLQETNYSMLIKRPQVSTENRFSAEVTNF